MNTIESNEALQSIAGTGPAAIGASNSSGSKPLAGAVQTVVRNIDDRLLKSIATSDAGPAFRPRTLLALLTYCYASQIYGSAEIEVVVRDDAYSRQLCSEKLPRAWDLREFRRRNRNAIHACLAAVLCLMAEGKIQEGLVTKVNRAHLADEAFRRLTMAMFIDSTELDGDSSMQGDCGQCVTC